MNTKDLFLLLVKLLQFAIYFTIGLMALWLASWQVQMA